MGPSSRHRIMRVLLRARDHYLSIVATIRVEPSVLVFLAIISKMVNNQCYNPYIFGKIFARSFLKCMGCSIVYRFRDKRKKHQHRKLNSYRSNIGGDYTSQVVHSSCDLVLVTSKYASKPLPRTY